MQWVASLVLKAAQCACHRYQLLAAGDSEGLISGLGCVPIRAMETLPLSTTFPTASRIVYGCMRLAGDWDAATTSPEQQQVADGALDTAIECGITVFDHADIYCHGRSESAFGDWLRRRPGLRDALFIQSKGGIRFADAAGPDRYDASRAHVIRSVEQSLTRLGIERLDSWLLHRPDPLLEVEELTEALVELKQAGKVGMFGVSNMSAAQVRWLSDSLGAPVAISQLEMSLARLDWLDGGVDFNTDRERSPAPAEAVADAMASHRQLQAWGSLCQGRYGASAEGGDEREQGIRALVSRLAGRYETSNEAIVLAFLLRHPAQIQPVIGSCSPGRIQSACDAVSLMLSREDWYALYAAARGESLP